MVESSGLLNRRRVKSSTGGSNPPLSAITTSYKKQTRYPALCARAHNRKNWLHVGSVKAGPKVAAILSVVESCRRLGVPVKEYLAVALPGLDRRKLSEVQSLTPARWSTTRT